MAELNEAVAKAEADVAEKQDALKKAKEALEKADSEYTDAVKASADAKDAHDKAVEAVTEAQKALEEAEAELKKAEKDLAEKQAAETTIAEVLENVANAKDALEEAIDKATQAGNAVENAEANLEDAEKALAEATDALDKAKDKLERAKALEYKGVDTPEITDPDFAYLNDYIAALIDADSELDKAQKAFDEAKKALDDAKAAYDKAADEYAGSKDAWDKAYEDYKNWNQIYSILDGSNVEHILNSGKDASIRVDAELGEFLYLTVDGKRVSLDDVAMTSGSTIATFKSGYLDTLSKGAHSVYFEFTHGSASATITVIEKAAEEAHIQNVSTNPAATTTNSATSATAIVKSDNRSNPNTGVSSPIGYGISLVGAIAALGYCVYKKKEDEEA